MKQRSAGFYAVWHAVTQNPVASIREIAEQTGLHYTTAGFNLKTLVDAGYIEHEPRINRAWRVVVPFYAGPITIRKQTRPSNNDKIWWFLVEHEGEPLTKAKIAAACGVAPSTVGRYLTDLKNEAAIEWEETKTGYIYTILNERPEEDGERKCPICKCLNSMARTCALCEIHVGPGHFETRMIGDICAGCHEERQPKVRAA